MEAADRNAARIREFYAAFDRADGEAMARCYTPDARFSDPVFSDLRGERIGAMWRMLTSRSTDLDVELAEHEAGEEVGTARWIARYTFSTGRRVVNDIRASFRFRDGLIAEHDDSFDFHAWSRQALGLTGTLLGWTPLLRAAVRRKAAADLERFESQA